MPDLGARRDVMVACPLPGHDDETPSMIVHIDTDRFHCFGCGAHGDVLELVERLEGVTSLSRAAELLDTRRALRSYPSTRPAPSRLARGEGRGTGSDTGTGTGTGKQIRGAVESANGIERPDLERTPRARVLEVNTAAWAYLTAPARAAHARSYLGRRGIDVRALEDEIGRALAGHSPASPTALVEHCWALGFTTDELVDAGWASRRPGRPVLDTYRGRVLLPARDDDDQILGVYARDVTGRSSTRYLNTPETAVFAKRHVLYEPLQRALREDGVVVVCEGALDALSIAAVAASARAASSWHAETLLPVSPSGTVLTTKQVRLVLRLGGRPPVLCGDGDAAGRRATASWATALIAEGRECLVTLLPGEQDPAEWLARHGVDGLGAFTPRDSAHQREARGSGQGSGPEAGGNVYPGAPWRLITGAVCDELCHVGYTGDELATAVVRRLAAIGERLVSRGARQRLALDAGEVLEEKHLGRASHLASEVTDAITGRRRASSPRTERRADHLASREISPTAERTEEMSL